MEQWNSFPSAIESLRIDLQRAEYIDGSAESDLVESIRCILLIRLAAMEAAQAILQSLTFAAPVTANTVPLFPALSLAALEALEEATQSVPPQKLD
jgi:hypothetical protein